MGSGTPLWAMNLATTSSKEEKKSERPFMLYRGLQCYYYRD